MVEELEKFIEANKWKLMSRASQKCIKVSRLLLCIYHAKTINNMIEKKLFALIPLRMNKRFSDALLDA